ncbi:MAG: septum formation inhibitor Maf [Acidobacteria bacterium]|nr:MAG: septum formation inhibitor Maf [Acidobacteriota bacterium]
MSIILATESKYKRKLFDQLGLTYQAIAPDLEETFVKDLCPEEQATRLARLKASSLKTRYPQHIIIGCDQVLSFQGKLLQKPGTVEKTVAQLKELRGKEHQLHTAIAVLRNDPEYAYSECVTSRITFYPDHTGVYLRRMVEEDASWDCVGGYKIESRGITLMQSVVTDDYSAIIGLPLLALTRVLRNLGYFK